MAKKNTPKKASSKKVSNTVLTTKTVARTRSPKGHVKATILSSLATGPKTKAQLLKTGGFSAASLYLNLKLLEDEKRIEATGRGLPVRLITDAKTASPNLKSTASLPVLKTKPGAKVAVLAEYVDGALHDALEAVSARFAAPEQIGAKLHTLEQLSATLPPAIAEVLLAIRADLLRLSPGRSS